MTAKFVEAVLVPSLTERLMIATPLRPKAGVTVAVRLLPLLTRLIPVLGTRLVFNDNGVTVRLPAVVSESETIKGTVTGTPVRVLVGGISLTVGGPFTGCTVTRKLVLLDAPPESMTRTVTVDVPTTPAAETVTVRVSLLPPKVILLNGMADVLDDALARVRLPAGS